MGLWPWWAFSALAGSLHLCLSFHFLLSFLITLLLALVVVTASGCWDVKQWLLIVFDKWLGNRIVEENCFRSDKNQLWEWSFSMSWPDRSVSDSWYCCFGGAANPFCPSSSPRDCWAEFFFFFNFWGGAGRILVPWSEVEPWVKSKPKAVKVLSLNPWTTRDSLGCIFKEIPKIGVMRLGQVQLPKASCSFKIFGGLLWIFLAACMLPLVVVHRLLIIMASLLQSTGSEVRGLRRCSTRALVVARWGLLVVVAFGL